MFAQEILNTATATGDTTQPNKNKTANKTAALGSSIYTGVVWGAIALLALLIGGAASE